MGCENTSWEPIKLIGSLLGLMVDNFEILTAIRNLNKQTVVRQSGCEQITLIIPPDYKFQCSTSFTHIAHTSSRDDYWKAKNYVV